MPAPTQARSRAPAASRQARVRPARAWIWTATIGLALLIAAVLTVTSMSASRGSTDAPEPGTQLAPLTAGATASRLELTDAATGQRYALLPRPGTLALVSFLDTQPDTANTPSRNQAVVLDSLATQYRANGLRVAIVDDSPTPADSSTLTNTAYDWQLGSLALLADPGHTAERSYGVTTAPTSYLISSTGKVLARWMGYVLTSTAAAAITANLPGGTHP